MKYKYAFELLLSYSYGEINKIHKLRLMPLLFCYDYLLKRYLFKETDFINKYYVHTIINNTFIFN